MQSSLLIHLTLNAYFHVAKILALPCLLLPIFGEINQTYKSLFLSLCVAPARPHSHEYYVFYEIMPTPIIDNTLQTCARLLSTQTFMSTSVVTPAIIMIISFAS